MNQNISINNIKNYSGVYHGVTTNLNTKEETIWDNVYIQFQVLDNGCGHINGMGKSIFRNYTIPFIIVGEFNSYLKYVTFRKVHISKKVKNVISYKANLEFYMNRFTISMNSTFANGNITFMDTNNNSEFKGNIFKLTDKEAKPKRFSCF